MFPAIKTIDDLLPYVRDNPQFRVVKQPNGMIVICYVLQDDDTFSGEHEDFYKECRGITFDRNGKVASRSLHKFQNVGENKQTHPDLIPWDRIVRVMSKLDGSMVCPVLVDNKVICKTKKTFTSAEAVAATEWLHRDTSRLEVVMEWLKAGYTLTFEWTSPKFPIVLKYEQEELTLLHIRENTTGRYLITEVGNIMPECFPFKIVENLRSQFEDPRELLELAKTTEGIEGWVIQADDGEMWKIKTTWYVKLHRSCSFARWRDLARAVIDETSDDLKAAFALIGRSIEPIVEVENAITSMIWDAQSQVERIVKLEQGAGSTPKDVALKFSGHPLFGHIMSTFRGKTIDWLDWYRKNHLDAWPLEVIPTAVQNEDVEIFTS